MFFVRESCWPGAGTALIRMFFMGLLKSLRWSGVITSWYREACGDPSNADRSRTQTQSLT